MQETDKAYLAGIIDGEGTIHATINDSGAMTSWIAVYNTDKDLMDWIEETFIVGGVYQVKRRQKHWKTSYVWKCNGRAGASVLKAVLPYLRVKKAKAEKYIEIHEGMNGTGQNYGNVDLDRRLRLVHEMQQGA
jgi:hypothetical protein